MQTTVSTDKHMHSAVKGCMLCKLVSINRLAVCSLLFVYEFLPVVVCCVLLQPDCLLKVRARWWTTMQNLIGATVAQYMCKFGLFCHVQKSLLKNLEMFGA